MSAPSVAQLRRYVLRQLPSVEADAIETACFTAPGVLPQLEDIEDDVIREFLAGSSSPTDRAAFERSLEMSPALCARLAFVRGLEAEVARARFIGPSRARPGWIWTGMAAAAALVVAVGAWWRMGAGTEAPIPPSAPAQAQAGGPASSPGPAAASTTPEPRPAIVLALSTLATRSGGATPTALVPADAAIIVLRLSDPLPALSTLTAEVRGVDTGGAWQGAVRAPRGDAPAGTAAEVDVPAAELPPGDYVLSIREGAGPGPGPIARAFFRIARP